MTAQTTTQRADVMARAQKFVNDMIEAGEDAYKLMRYAQHMKAECMRLSCYIEDEEKSAIEHNAAILWGCVADILNEDEFDNIDPEFERIQAQADKDIAELRESLQPYGEDED
jgi:hypothetical protein